MLEGFPQSQPDFRVTTEGRIPYWLGSLVAFSVVAIYVSKGGLRGISWVAVPVGAVWCVLSIWLGRKQRQLAEAKPDQAAPLSGAAAPEAA